MLLTTLLNSGCQSTYSEEVAYIQARQTHASTATALVELRRFGVIDDDEWLIIKANERFIFTLLEKWGEDLKENPNTSSPESLRDALFSFVDVYRKFSNANP